MRGAGQGIDRDSRRKPGIKMGAREFSSRGIGEGSAVRELQERTLYEGIMAIVGGTAGWREQAKKVGGLAKPIRLYGGVFACLIRPERVPTWGKGLNDVRKEENLEGEWRGEGCGDELLWDCF